MPVCLNPARLRGSLSEGELAASPGYPSAARLERGPCAVIECVEAIPCNPCEPACPHGAIRVGQPITNVPVLDEDRCIGCGLCLAACPGLAIFLVDASREDGTAAVSLPYEYLPLPRRGETVIAVTRDGVACGTAVVERVLKPKRNDRTPILTVVVPREVANQVRGIMPREGTSRNA